jgi:hypothetical protein
MVSNTHAFFFQHVASYRFRTSLCLTNKIQLQTNGDFDMKDFRAIDTNYCGDTACLQKIGKSIYHSSPL